MGSTSTSSAALIHHFRLTNLSFDSPRKPPYTVSFCNSLKKGGLRYGVTRRSSKSIRPVTRLSALGENSGDETTPGVGSALEDRPDASFEQEEKASSIYEFLYPAKDELPDDKEMTIFDHLEELRQKRTLYTHEKWVEHRSSLRHVHHLFSSFSSRVILSLIPPVFFFTSVAIFIASYNSAVALDWLPSVFPILRSSSLPYQLTAPALALLLVFRTEASYSRYEEGRKAWVGIIAGTDDLARQVICSVDGSGDELVIKDLLLRYVAAFPVALKCHVTYGSDVARDLQNLIEGDDLSLILESKHRPRCVIEFISQSLQLLKLDDTKRDLLESKMLHLHEGIGVCEQLMGIPIPLAYTRLTSRFLVFWHLTLPIILWDECHWIVVPATFISAASLFCIEEVGVLIEEPFPMLALDELCALVHSNIQEAVKSESIIRNRIVAKIRFHEVNHSSNGRHRS